MSKFVIPENKPKVIRCLRLSNALRERIETAIRGKNCNAGQFIRAAIEWRLDNLK